MSVHSDEEQSRARNDLVSAYGGYLIVFDEERRAGVLRERVYFRTFTDTLSAPDWSPGTIEVCLLSFGDDEIHAAGLLTRGGRVATAKYRVTFSEIFEFEPEIQLRDLTRVLS